MTSPPKTLAVVSAGPSRAESDHRFEESILNFQGGVSLSLAIECLSQNLYFGDLRAGQFRDLPIISQWRHFQKLCFSIKSAKLHADIYEV